MNTSTSYPESRAACAIHSRFSLPLVFGLVFVPLVSPGVAAGQATALNMVAVGISRYQYPGMNLNYSAKDAQDLTAAFRRNRLFSGGQVTVLTDAQATVGNITKALALLQRRANQQTFTVLYLSGHGGRDAHGHFYFPAHDYDPRRLAATSISCERIQSALHRIPGRVFLIIDACHSAAAGHHKHGGHWVSPANHMVTISSSLPHQTSLEMGNIRNGAFTRGFLEGSNGAADANRDSQVTLGELHAYVQRRVLQLTGGRQQTATYVPSPAHGNLKMAVLANRNNGAAVVWRGRENLSGYGGLSFAFYNGGQVLMTDARGRTQGTWTRQGNAVTLRFHGGRVVYAGRISGRTLSGTAANQKSRWQFAVTQN